MSRGPAGEVYRIDWVPGTDELLGLCHCGAARRADDPVQMWEWMLGHGHAPAPQAAGENEGTAG